MWHCPVVDQDMGLNGGEEKNLLRIKCRSNKCLLFFEPEYYHYMSVLPCLS